MSKTNTPPGPLRPGRDCPLCPRLAAYRAELRKEHPDWFNAPVPPAGETDARFAIIGLAPGRNGANRTGRVFTGDGAGELLFPALLQFGFARGIYARTASDGMELQDCAIINAVRCVPPQNRPSGAEIRNCRQFLASEIDCMPRLRIALALGRTAHENALRVRGLRLRDYGFRHGARHALPGLVLYDSYHCSRYNTNTSRLTEAMFHGVFRNIRDELDALPPDRPAVSASPAACR